MRPLRVWLPGIFVLPPLFFSGSRVCSEKKGMQHGEGLLITPCKGIHTVGMRFDIDVAILDRDNRVIALHRRLRPYRLTPIYFRASSVLELPAGALDDASTKVGDVITIV